MYGIGNISATLTDILIPNAGIGDVPYLSDDLGKKANQRKRNNVSAKEFAQIFNSNILNDYPVTPLKIDIKLPNGGLYTAIAKTLEDAQSIAYKEYVLGNPFFIRDDVDTLVLMFDYDSNGKPYFANEHTYMLYMPKNIDCQTQEKFTIKKRRLPKGEPFLSNKQAAAKKAYDNAHKIKPTDVFRLYTEDSPRLHFAAEKVAEHLFDVPLTRSNIINVIDNMQLVMDLPGYQVPSDDEVLETIKTRIVDGLGKPTIKLEFETNSELADFLSSNKQRKQYAPYTDVTATETPTAANAKAKSKIRNGILMPADDSRTFHEPPTASALPPTKTPPPLPPAPTAKALPEYVEPKLEQKWANVRAQIQQYKAQYTDAIVFGSDDQYYFTFDNDAKICAEIMNDKYIAPFGYPVFGFLKSEKDKVVSNLVKAGYKVVFTVKHPETIISEYPQQSPTEREQQQPSEPQTAAPDWADLQKRFERASNWASMDPEASARSNIKGWKEMYDYYVSQVAPEKISAFNSFFNNYVNNLIHLRSNTASWAVTGGGGIDARRARIMNERNDRYFETSAKFRDTIENYITKLNRRANRAEFINTSIDDRYAQRISELKKEVDSLMHLKDMNDRISKAGTIPEDVQLEYAWMRRIYGEKDLPARIAGTINYDLNLKKATFKDKLTREVSKGNVEIVDAIIDYLKPKGLFTNRAEIWQFPSFVRTRRKSVERETQRVADAAENENALYRVEYDTQEDRVKIYFNGIPSEKIRTWLKSNGFRWSPKNKAWQRQITENARYYVRKFEELVKDGTLGKPTIKFEFEDNADLMSLFDTDGISGMTVNDKPAAVFNCKESELDCQGFTPTYKRLHDYSHLIDTADGAKTLKGYGFDRTTLDELINACNYYPQVSRLAAHLKDPAGDPLQSAFNVWHWLHTNIRYDYDTPGQEEIRTPARTWADRESGVDCDCLAVMTACLLLNMGYKPKFEIVAFNGSDTYSHIYVTLDGNAIDRVLPVFLARPSGITKTKIMDIPVYSLSGVDGCNTLSGVYASTLAKIQNGTATGEDINDLRKTQVLVTLRGIDDAAYSLAALLMPHVVTIADDGTYYFDSTAMAQLATKLDHDLADLISNNADAETISQWIAAAAKQIDGAASVTSNGGNDTIVVIINPQGATTRVIGQMVKSQTDTLTPLTQTATATDTAAQTYAQSATPAIMQTSAMPGVSPNGDTANEESDSNNWLWIAGIAAALGIGAAVASNKKKRR